MNYVYYFIKITYEEFTFLQNYWKEKLSINHLPTLIIYIDIPPDVCYSV